MSRGESGGHAKEKRWIAWQFMIIFGCLDVPLQCNIKPTYGYYQNRQRVRIIICEDTAWFRNSEMANVEIEKKLDKFS